MLCAVNECPMIYAVNNKNKVKMLSMVGSIPKLEEHGLNQRGGGLDPSSAEEQEEQEDQVLLQRAQ
jgi:hypothetical protein